MGKLVCRASGAALIAIACAATPAAAGPHGLAVIDAADVPARWTAQVALGDDRSGDLRPEAAALLEAVADHGGPFTLGDARALGLAPPATRTMARVTSIGDGAPPVTETIAYAPPPSIRIWRRGLDGSTASCSGRVDVIPFEQYIKGVLPHEWIRSWDDESLLAGGVAIRTYAAAWVAAGGKYTCADLDDTTASQVYRDEFFADTSAAVDATVGQMVVRDGELVFAEYSAENSDPTAFGVDEPLCTGEDLFGHGRGTCQWGTQRWALDGQTYDWMMRHYYPGSDVEGIAPVWAATLAAQDVRTELVSGEEIVVWLEYENDGSTTWDPASVMIGTTGPRDRDSAFFKAENWVSATRPTGADHSAQTPGSVARFTWAMLAPEVSEVTTFTESFGLVTADGTWFGPADDAVTWTFTVSPRSGAIPDDPDDPSDDGDDGALSSHCSSGGAGGALFPIAFAVALLIARRRRDTKVAIIAGATTIAVAAVLGGCSPGSAPARETPARTPLGGDSALLDLFHDVGAERGVPAELLATISYVETRLRFVDSYRAADGSHPGHTHAGAIGLLALTEGGPRDIARGAALAGLAEPTVHTDERASVAAAAALLAEHAPHAPRDLAAWRPALVTFGDDAFADEVLARIDHGWTGTDATGASLTLTAIELATPDDDGFSTVTQGLGYPGAIWNAAYAGNYSAGNRGAADINYIVIHTVQGSYAGCISWFKNPSAEVSAHYVVRSSDGQVTQMVDDSDVAWHDACFNSQTIGIEHEGYVGDPDAWYTENMYVESAKLTAWLADSYGIPKDRDHIVGHGDAPDCSDHTDPGSGWDWDHYMDLVRTGGTPQFDAASSASDYPTTMRAGDEAVVWFELANQSNVTWGIDETRLGTQEPQDRDSAFFVDGNWLAPNRASGADHSTYSPGAVGRFTFVIRAPEVSETTTFDEAFQLVQEGVSWFGPVVHMTITVSPREGDDPGDPDLGGNPGLDLADGDPAADSGAISGHCNAGGDGGPGGAILVLGVLLGALRRRRGR